MSSESPSSIQNFYREKVHISSSHFAKSSFKRQLDSNDNHSHSFKIARSVSHCTDVTLEDDEGTLTKEISPVRSKYSFNLYPDTFLISLHIAYVNCH